MDYKKIGTKDLGFTIEKERTNNPVCPRRLHLNRRVIRWINALDQLLVPVRPSQDTDSEEISLPRSVSEAQLTAVSRLTSPDNRENERKIAVRR